jgi:hypothetical protein
MKGCARSCFLWILGVIAAGGAFFFYFRRLGQQEPQIWWAAGGAGLCAVLVISYFIGIANVWKERAMLLGAMVGRPPDDGRWVAVSGTIRSINPLRAPLTGASVVAYQYSMSRMVTSGSGRNRSTSKVAMYEGKALAQSTIASKQGAIRLLAVPTFDVPLEKALINDMQANAREYLRTTTFETSETPKDQRTGIAKEAADDDGIFRFDKKSTDEGFDPVDLILEERHIKQGEMVCAFGLYSSQRGGLIPHPNWAKQARLMRGDANSVAAQLQTRMIKYCLGIVIFAAAAYGVVKLYAHYLTTL